MGNECYQIDCKMKGVCQDTGCYGRNCKRYNHRDHTEMVIVGPPTPPLKSNWHPTWEMLHRRNWVTAIVYDGDRVFAFAVANRHLSYRKVGHLAGFPDHSYLGEAVRAALQIYCNHAGKPFPLRDPSRRRRKAQRPALPPVDLVVTGRE